MSKAADLLIWDSSSCQSQSIDFIPQLQRLRKVPFAGIIVVAPDPQTVPPSIGDLSIAYPVTVRLGLNALHDALIDAVGFFVQSKGQSGFVVITNSFALWLALFQRLEPKSVVLVSSKDPTKCLEFSFLPEHLPIRTLAWPILEEATTPARDDAPSPAHPPIEPIPEEEDEEAAGNSEDDQGSEGGSRQGTTQPFPVLEKHQIDLRSPSASTRGGEATPKRRSPEQAMQVPAKFQPLVEAMRATGKVMVPVADLEGQMKAWAAKLGQPVDDRGSHIQQAADAQIVIWDKAINYVRFKNRALSTAPVEYV
jgi:hypothetical protein